MIQTADDIKSLNMIAIGKNGERLTACVTNRAVINFVAGMVTFYEVPDETKQKQETVKIDN